MEDKTYFIDGVEFSQSNYDYQQRVFIRHFGASGPMSYAIWKLPTNSNGYTQTSQSIFKFEYINGKDWCGKPSECNWLCASPDIKTAKSQFAKAYPDIKEFTVEHTTDYAEFISDSICVLDFCGSVGSLHGINMWADWYYKERVVKFFGAYYGTPDMPSETYPDEDKVAEWLDKHPSETFLNLMMESEKKRTDDFLMRYRLMVSNSSS